MHAASSWLRRITFDPRYPFEALPPAGIVPFVIAIILLVNTLVNGCVACQWPVAVFFTATLVLILFECITHFSSARILGYLHALLMMGLITMVPLPDTMPTILISRPGVHLYGTLYLFGRYGPRVGLFYLTVTFIAFVGFGRAFNPPPTFIESLGAFVILGLAGMITAHMYAVGRTSRQRERQSHQAMLAALAAQHAAEVRAAQLNGAILTARGAIHEVSQPLSAAMGYAEMIRDMPQPANDQISTYTRHTIVNLRAAAQRLEQLQGIVRVQAGPQAGIAPYLDVTASVQPDDRAPPSAGAPDVKAVPGNTVMMATSTPLHKLAVGGRLVRRGGGSVGTPSGRGGSCPVQPHK